MPRTSPHRYTAYDKAHKKDTLQRMNARNRYEKKHGEIPPGYDLDHKKSIKSGGSNNPKNLRVRSAHANRGDKTF